MALDDAYTAIRTRLSTEWPNVESTVPLGFANENFQRDGAGSEFLVAEVLWSGGEGISIGAVESGNLARRYGRLWLHALTPLGVGNARGLELVSEAALLFEDKDLGSGLIFENMEPGGTASNTDDGLYFQVSASIGFQYDEIVGGT